MNRTLNSPLLSRLLSRVALPVVLTAAALSSGALPAQDRRGLPGHFDYYVLSLSWAPEFCAQPGEPAANTQECQSGRNVGFVVHGLWPEMTQGTAPEFCGGPKTVSRGIVNSMLASMPSPGLIQHEWARHGSCTGLDMASYFTSVLLARAAVQIPVQLSSIGQTVTESPREVEAQFAGSNPSFPKGAFRVSCQNGALTEVRACLDKDLKPIVCSAGAGECRSASIAIRQVR